MTLKDLSRELGVSPSTISRVLNGSTKNFTIPDALRKKILDHVRKCGYQPNPVFRSLRKHELRQVVILFYSRSTLGVGYTFEMMVDRASRYFDANNYDISFTFNRMLPYASEKYILPPWKCSGVLIPDCNDPEKLSLIDESDTPYVCMNGIAGANGTSVIADEKDGMEKILRHFADLGHRRIAYIITVNKDERPYDIGELRRKQFLLCAQELELEPLIVNIQSSKSYGTFDSAELERFDGTPPCLFETPDFTANLLQSGISAVICYDSFVMELLYWANKAGIRIPRDLSVVCYNDLPFLRRTIPNITSFRVPAEEIGGAAAQILLKKIQIDPNFMRGETVQLKGNLIFRESTAACSTDNGK